MILRNEFNVGHIFFSLLKREEYDQLYQFLEYSIEDFRKLLLIINDKLHKNEFSFKTEIDFNLIKDKQKLLNKLIDSINKRNSKKYENERIHEYEAIGTQKNDDNPWQHAEASG